MRIPKALYLTFAAVLLASLLPLTVAARPGAEGALIEQELLDAFNTNGTANFFVKMAIEADLSAAYDITDWSARGQYVYDALQQVADATQAPVIDFAQRNGLEYASMLTTNSVFIRGGDLAAAQGLAALPGVAYLRLERIVDIPDPVGAGINGFVGPDAAPDATLAWGIDYVDADQVWVMGFQGAGIKVANIDTGVQWDHPALVGQYACPGDPGNADCWADPSNICGGTACDNNGHGTHTMGTMVALDDENLTYIAGMAPESTWIACKGCESNSCSEFALTTCADWIVAPGGNPDNRPHVVNNSWGGGGGDPWYQGYVNAWRAAGTFPAFSAGNNGSSCGTLGTPGDYQESFGSAAHASSGDIASFSSRGPSAFGHDPYTKPNIASPGVSVCSTVPTNGWSCGYSGTSMASPHSAGAVALVWNACPDFVGQIDQTFELLQSTTNVAPAGNCGAPPDGEGNYTFGYGYLNALNAVMACAGGLEFGTLEGYVYDQDMNPIEGATVTASPSTLGSAIDAVTDPNGFYTMDLIPGFYDVTATKLGYDTVTELGVEVVANQTTQQDFTLTFIGEWQYGPGLCFDFNRFDAEYFPATGLVYVLGGRSGADTNGSIFSFDPVSGDCADTGTDMPVPISNYSVNLINDGATDWLCTFGGRPQAGGTTPEVQCYDPIANSAIILTNLPGGYGTYLPGAQVVVDNVVYVFGGFDPAATPAMTDVTFKYDILTNTWTQLGDLGLARSYLQAAAVDGMIYAFGGDTFDGVNLVAVTLAEMMDPAAGVWNDGAVADLPVASGEGRAFAFDSDSAYEFAGQIIHAGGGQWPDQTAAVIAYDVASDTYDQEFPDLNVWRRDHAGVFVPAMTDANGVPGMWVLGGNQGSDDPPYAPAEFYDVGFAGVEDTMHVFDIEGYFSMDYMGRPVLRIHVGVEDQSNEPLSDVLVTSWIWVPDGGPFERDRYTKPSGYARFHWGSKASGTWEICVQDLALAGYTYVPGDNVVTCMDWDY